ncbi:MAG TPA: VOC family protein [Chitinophagaceae bacterium]
MTKDQINLKQAVPFFMVTNMEMSLEFYSKGLGFEVKLNWKPEGKIEWCWLERDKVALMLQEYRRQFMPEEKPGVGVSICFMCTDALTLYKEYLEKKLAPQEPFVGNNLWVLQLTDPDGYKLCFESPTYIPEGTLYSEYLKG